MTYQKSYVSTLVAEARCQYLDKLHVSVLLAEHRNGLMIPVNGWRCHILTFTATSSSLQVIYNYLIDSPFPHSLARRN